MNHFSIRDIENLSGIKAHTLRIWEQRYQLLIPKRKESKHRYYDNEDLKHILRISHLYHNGVKISRIASLDQSMIRNLALEHTRSQLPAPLLVNQLIEASIDFDEEAFEAVFAKSLHLLGFESTILDVVYPFLEKIGLLWLTDHAIPAQEHFASNIIRRKIIAAIDALPLPQPDPGLQNTTVLFTPEGEWHELPLLMLQYFFRQAGRNTVYLGVNVPLNDLAFYVKHKSPARLLFYGITHLFDMDINQVVETLLRQFPKQQIIMAGPLTSAVHLSHPQLSLIRTQGELIQFAKGNILI